jgi:4-hydroxy-4-methyl-2-oxoglutarate aldolase
MRLESWIEEEELSALRQFDTGTISNAIETFEVRLCNTGFADRRIRCLFEDFPPVVGYAATRTSSHRRATNCWRHLARAHRLVEQYLAGAFARHLVHVLEHHDARRGMHGAILRGLGCVVCVTNGAVRELPRVRALGLQAFAGNVAVSHSYPRQVAGKVPRVATKLRQFEEKVIAFCQSREFSLETTWHVQELS